MRYRVVVTTDDSQFVAAQTDDFCLAKFIADYLEHHPYSDEVFIEEENKK